MELFYLTKNKDDWQKYETAYLVSTHATLSNPFLFTVHLESGALFSGLPIKALRHDTDPPAPPLRDELLCYWGSISDTFQVFESEYLKHYEVRYKDVVGKYWFSVEPLSGGYAEDPEQYKFLHCIALESGQFILTTNNELKFIDKHFVNELLPTDHYRRNTEKYTAW